MAKSKRLKYSTEDLKSIASFNKIVMNYIKMQKILKNG